MKTRDNESEKRDQYSQEIDSKVSHSKEGTSKASGRRILNRDFQKMSYSRMIFSGLGNLVLLIICFWIHWSLGVLFMIFWLFILPYLDMRRLRRYEAENPTPLPPKDSFDDTPFLDDPSETQSNKQGDDQWKAWDDWDAWGEEGNGKGAGEDDIESGKKDYGKSEGKE
ncbi:hypothetical protein [Ignatzschineria cameli]|uniref:2TM domain-containing protein n=1 Tax=Ignatzschineria cameli TaxID=2182793 RepID=A0A2U2ASG1_9GAMM|nr:hypothetical protein [Ignatzschineria cameli]PWD86453.1 hypothetical protein DC080_02080 [Ignatzschineria cameli]PWD87193.1 hypothetical protein DC077_05170 [Ignatzschineria cameli]